MSEIKRNLLSDVTELRQAADDFRKTRNVHNVRASHFLFKVLDVRNWNELELARRSGISRSVVSTHLSGQRRINVRHLSAYLKVLERPERALFLSAWLEDNVSAEVVADLFNGTGTDWWATAIGGSRKLARIFERELARAAKHSPVLIWFHDTTDALSHLLAMARARLTQAGAGIMALILALCHARIPEKATELAEQAIPRAAMVTTSLAAAPALMAAAPAEPSVNLDFNRLCDCSLNFCDCDLAEPGRSWWRPPASSPPARSAPARKQRAIAKRAKPGPGVRLTRTIKRQWRQIARFPKRAARTLAHLSVQKRAR